MLQIFLLVHGIASLTMTEACEGARQYNFVFGQFDSLHLNQGEYVCADLRDVGPLSTHIYGFVALGEGLIFEGFSDNICQKTSEGSFVSTYLVTKVTATVSTDVQYIATSIPKSTSQVNYFYQLCLESTYSGTITTSISSSRFVNMDVFLYLNPSGGTITVTPDRYSRVSITDINGNRYSYNTQQTRTGPFFMIVASDNPLVSGSSDFSVDIEIQSKSTPMYYPERTISLSENEVYGRSVHKGCVMPDSSSLSTGVIIGIVVAVIVVVAIIVFCIIWFVVLKKTCGSSKDENAEVEA